MVNRGYQVFKCNNCGNTEDFSVDTNDLQTIVTCLDCGYIKVSDNDCVGRDIEFDMCPACDFYPMQIHQIGDDEFEANCPQCKNSFIRSNG